MFDSVAFAPFDERHLDGAASLLAGRHRAQRLVESGLDPAFEEPAACRAEIEALLPADGTSGVAAVAGENIVGYLLGTPLADSWGPNCWVTAAGHAVREAELVRDLYAEAARRWVEEGRTSHYALVPATDPALVDAWFRLGFGHQHVHAIREVPDDGALAPADGIVVRRAERRDIEQLARLDLTLPEHQAQSPVFSRLPPPSFEDVRAEWESDFADERFATFVAERDGHVIGAAVGCPIEVSSTHTGLALPRGAAFLGFAAVLPQARGGGAGRLLGERIIAWAREAGHPTIVTDWRMTNLLASRTWPRLGFRPIFYRLFRAIA